MRRSEWRHTLADRVDVVPLANGLPPSRIQYCSGNSSASNPKLGLLQAHISLFYRAPEIVEDLNLKAKPGISAGTIRFIEMQHEITISHRFLIHLISPGK